MGEVYEAEDLTLHGTVALKTILPEIASDAKAVARFKRELGATALHYREIGMKRLPYAIYTGVREAMRKPAKAPAAV